MKASLARDQRSVLLALPNKEGWRFKTNAGAVELEKSVYCGAGGAPVASEQIVIRASSAIADGDGGADVKWALKRLDAA